ncbi:2,3-butanediol dehydrogenase [Olivibacter sitiensis]|uniref:2,3-butanediol dehydrogenase n=1 Tax=Olivibacter sitiensis TaxID=376470 RepID=UPI001B7FB131|nr:2,3-butanediol dehydrogenase [Olivibacter sitiensis]
MKAARWHGEKDIRVEEVEIEQPGKHQVQVEVKYAGICGSDLHEYTHGPMIIPFNEPYPLTGHKGVTTMGHEFAGVVSAVGEGVKDIKVGDRVAIEPMYRNKESAFYVEGNYNLGEHFGFVGLSSNGGFAKYVVVEDYMVNKIPDSMSFELGALVEPAAVAVHAVRNSGLQIGDTCTVFGVGPIGLLTIQAVKAAGASKIIAIDVSEARLKKAEEVGATHVINGKDTDLVDQIKEITGARGVQYGFEVAGVQPTFTNLMKSLRNGGTCVIIALFAKPLEVDAFDIAVRELKIIGCLAYKNIFPEVIQLINEGKMDVAKLISNKIKLDDIVDKGFEALLGGNEIKVLVDIAAS